MRVGRILELSELTVEILLEETHIRIKDVLSTKNGEKEYHFEVAKVSGNRVSAMPFQSVIG